MKRSRMPSIGKGALSLALCLTFWGAAAPAFASAPRFSRTEAEWVELEDNVLEYGEIAALIQEYNPAVQKSQYEYRVFLRDYGEKVEEVSAAYQAMAEEILEKAVYPEEGELQYGAAMAAALGAELQAKSLLQKADENLEDGESYRLRNSYAFQLLVQSAEEKRIAHREGELEQAIEALDREALEEERQLTELKRELGMATEIELLLAGERLQQKEAALLFREAEQEKLLLSLSQLCGWREGRAAELSPLLPLPLSRLKELNPEQDLAEALASSYPLRILKRQRENAREELAKKTLSLSIEEAEGKIQLFLQSGKRAAEEAEESRRLAEKQSQLAEKKLLQLRGQKQAGLASERELRAGEREAEKAALSLQKAELELFKALESYRRGVEGCAPIQ